MIREFGTRRLQDCILGIFFVLLAGLVEKADAFINLSNVNPNGEGDEAEPTIAVHPTDSNVMIVVASGFLRLNTWRTSDGGLTWTYKVIADVEDNLGSLTRSDPSAAFAPDGNLYVVYLVLDVVTCVGGRRGRWIVCARSADQGVSYDLVNVLDLGCGTDKPFVGIGNRKDKTDYDYNIYIAYDASDKAVYIKRSVNHGVDFLSPTLLSENGTFAMPAVSRDGEVYVVWHDNPLVGLGRIKFAHSTDDGQTFPPDQISEIGGVEFPILYEVPPAPVRGIHPGPSLAVNVKEFGRYEGRIFVAYVVLSIDLSDPDSDDHSNVVVQSSDDMGATWSLPRIVHRTESQGEEKFRFLPWIAVDPIDETVVVLYLDARNGNNESVEPWVSASRDGGDIWYERKFEDVLTDESAAGSGLAINYLEYHGVVVANDLIRGVWAGDPTQQVDPTIADKDILFSTVTVSGFTTGTVLSPVLGVYPNPFRASTTLQYELDQPSYIKIDVFDIQGRRVAALLDEFRTAGPHSQTWTGRGDSGNHLASGVYYFRVSSGEHALSRKVILVR